MPKSFSLRELAQLTRSKLIGDPDYEIENVDDLRSASPRDASFLANSRYRQIAEKSKAGLICIDKGIPPFSGRNFFVSDDPSRTFQKIAEILLFDKDHQTGFQGIHHTAVIHESAHIGEHVTIGPYVVLDRGVSIGDHTSIYSHTSIGPAVVIGSHCTLYSGVTVRERSILHNHVILQPGTVIGSCGYGYTTDPKTGRHTKLDQIGTVILEDHVEVGANTTIDRARFKNTLIKRGTKIDNLVQIAHNVELGENNIIISQSGIAGSTKLGNNVFLGGQSGIVGHISITDNVKIASRGGVSKSIDRPGSYRGAPVSPIQRFNKREVHLRKIETYVEKIEKLEKTIQNLLSEIEKKKISS